MYPNTRRRARRLALQAVYQWQMSQNEISTICVELSAEANPKKTDLEYFVDLVKGVAANYEQINQEISPLLDRPLPDVNPIELAILRIAVYELLFRLDIPHKVVINEALEIAKIFGAESGHKFINGVLDKAAKKIR